MPNFDEDYDFPDVEDEEDKLGRPHGLRFGEGQPINRRGRPRGSPDIKGLVKRVAKMRLRVTIDGRVRTKSAIELILMAVQKKASEGDVAAFKIQQSMLEGYEVSRKQTLGVLVAGRKLTSVEWEAAYGNTMTDEEVTRDSPYMMRMRLADKAYRAKIDSQFIAAKVD
jgi:hypothetical protein